ncbi:MAG TPA: YceD family protein [Oculatellaceae cyanobacterium]
MQPHPEPLPHETFVDAAGILRIKPFLNSRTSVLRLEDQYVYEDLKTDGPVICEWEIRQETAGLRVHGHVSGTVMLECARCLEEFPVPVAVALDERYVLERYVDTTERERELQAEDFFETIREDGELDLQDLAHQFLILETAEHSVCGRAECSLA